MDRSTEKPIDTVTGNVQFFDGVGEVWLNNGVVRMDLVALHGQGAGNSPVARQVQELAIPLAQFVRFCMTMTNSLQEMEQQGIIERHTKEETVPPVSG